MTAPPARGVQARILAAAVGLFAERGFDATSVQEVVERAAVTKGALYHYFRSKDDLLYEIYHGLISQQLAELDRILAAGPPPAAAIREIIVSLVETTTARRAEAAIFAREMHRLEEGRMAALRAERRRYHETFRDVVAGGQRAGVFGSVASPETVTLVVFGLINQLPQWYRPDGPKSPRQLADEIADFVLAALT
ncbi:MAG TPA: TetR/AcrR family transcriptional regulator, partial [Pilimelia sp.]|nr:TetR/AcrR family transcriptional regulator [Pilimelia sp.]